MEDNHFNCIYCYTNKINGKKYVGQAKNFNKRHNSHICASYNEERKGYNLPFHNAIRKYGIENFTVEILKENLKDYNEMDYWERYYIAEFDLLVKNGKGYNLSDGGGNGNNFAGKTEEEMAEIYNDEFKEKVRKRMLENNPMDNEVTRMKVKEKVKEWHKNLTEEERNKINKKIGESNKGRQHSEETKEKLHDLFYGENSPRAKKINQYDINGNLIKTWNCQADACRYYNSGGITQARNRGTNYSLGFIWLEEDEELTDEILKKAQKLSEGMKGENNPMYGRKGEKHPMYGKNPYEGKSDEELKEISRKQSEARKDKYKGKNSPSAKKVVQYDLNGSIIKIWDCAMDISRELNIGYSGLRNCLQGRKKINKYEYKGFIWRYIDEITE